MRAHPRPHIISTLSVVAVTALAVSLIVGGEPATDPAQADAPLSPRESAMSKQTVGYDGSENIRPDPDTMASHAQERVTVSVTDFGADPSGKSDSTGAVTKAIDHAKSLHKPTTILFPCGNYQFYPEKAPTRELYVSNTTGAEQDTKDKSIGILIEDMSDVIVDGQGSHFTFHGDQTQFAAIDSTDVSFKDFDSDWFSPRGRRRHRD